MEVLGTIASLVVLISFLFDNLQKIRIINIIGCVLFIVYGLSISSFSVILLNGGLLLIHIYYLLRNK